MLPLVSSYVKGTSDIKEETSVMWSHQMPYDVKKEKEVAKMKSEGQCLRPFIMLEL